MAIWVTINGAPIEIDAPPETPLLWVLRDRLNLTGTKYGCGMGLCGACTVHVDGEAVRSCTHPLSEVDRRSITTIEGLGPDHRVQEAFLAEQVPQCGYCQSGQIMAAAALVAKFNDPTEEEIAAAMDGVLCRCGTYPRIRRAIQRAIKGV